MYDASIPCDGIAVYLERIHQTGDVVGVGAIEIARKVFFGWTRFAAAAQVNGDHVKVIAHELRLELRREIKQSCTNRTMEEDENGAASSRATVVEINAVYANLRNRRIILAL